MKKIAIILAGGNGTRFWPVSTTKNPKQFQSIAGDDTLLNDTIKRINKFLPMDSIYVVSSCNHKHLLDETLPSDFHIENILLEPLAKNTAAAIAASVNYLNSKYPNSTVGIFPSDHYIEDDKTFLSVIEKAYDTSYSTCKMVLLGIPVTYPATGYGYLKTSNTDNSIRPLEKFVEKPSYNKAQEYMLSNSYYWNSGIIVSKASVILMEVMKYMPELYFYSRQVTYWHQEYISGALEELYQAFPNLSMDYGILEHCDNLLMMPLDAGWSDLGSWDALPEILHSDSYGNIADSKQLLIDTRNTLVVSDKKIVATIGLEDLIIVETDDSLLICKKGHSQDIKKLVASLKEQERFDLI